MSSTDDKTDSGSQNKLDIEAFRHHLLNYRYIEWKFIEEEIFM